MSFDTVDNNIGHNSFSDEKFCIVLILLDLEKLP